MANIMDEYFENLVHELRSGKLSSGELIQKIDKSELAKEQILSPRAASIQEIKDDPSFEELCQQAEMLLSNAPILQKSKTKHLDLLKNPSDQNQFNYNTPHNNTQFATTLLRSPAFVKGTYLHLARDPLEEIGSINVQPDKLFQSLGKKSYTDDQIEKIRERTTQKRLEKAILLKQKSLMKELIEYETHCSFQPQTNPTKSKSVKSKYMASGEQKSPAQKPNKNENFTFRPQITEYKSNHKKKEYLDQNAFSRLSNTSTACQLSTRIASQATLHSETLLQQKKSTSPTPTSRSMVSRIESLQKLTKIPSNLNYSPKGNAMFISDMASMEEIYEKLESIKASPLRHNKAKSVGDQVFENEYATNPSTKENEPTDTSTKKSLSKVSLEFLERQETFESLRKDRLAKVTQSIAASHNPQLEEGSKKILQKKFGGSSNFENRSRYYESQKQQKLENIKKAQDPKFQPEISEYARSLSKEKVYEVRTNSLKKAELTVKNIRRQKSIKECAELIFHPEINTKFVAESRLGLDKNLTDYVQDLRTKEKVVRNFKEVLDRRRQLQETIECTHQPQINEFPSYLNQQKDLFESNLKNKFDLADDKYTIIQKKTRSTGKKYSIRSEAHGQRFHESTLSNTDLESGEKIERSKRTVTTKSGEKNGDHTLTLTSEDLFSRSHQMIGDDEEFRPQNIVEEAIMRTDLDRLQISQVLSPPYDLNSEKKRFEIEVSSTKEFNDEENVYSPRLAEVNTSFFSFPASPAQGSGRKPPLPSLWRKN